MKHKTDHSTKVQIVSHFLERLDKHEFATSREAFDFIAQALLTLESIETENPSVLVWIALCNERLAKHAKEQGLVGLLDKPDDQST